MAGWIQRSSMAAAPPSASRRAAHSSAPISASPDYLSAVSDDVEIVIEAEFTKH